MDSPKSEYRERRRPVVCVRLGKSLCQKNIDKGIIILYHYSVAIEATQLGEILTCRRGGIGRRTGLKILRDINLIPVRPRSPAAKENNR